MKKMTLLIGVAFSFTNSPAAALGHNRVVYPPTGPLKHCYANTLHSVKLARAQLGGHQSTTTDLLGQRFTQLVADSILPYWYGTAWDFNGTSQTPGTGAIACGYFVSTVLRDAGLRVNRVKMGQMDSEEMIHHLAEKKDTKLFYEKPLTQVLAYLRQQGAGLYIIGLNSHVGFILVDDASCWFIHAKWFGEKAVVKEDAATSNILYYATYRMVAKISTSRKLLHAWVYGAGL